ncbi:class I SAM-dependent methyltransferase [Thiohalocapsa marina]|uniref:Class I SAM-dependent methyltransferase n=1 Tax=Thiohalocapsa marina TaxID=424902 RepID=A0A5M8FIN5_9GAMM|nr:class I SAM-dependent methyltransferase [Thiohalocapsa marina]KAA6183850.1 class I SAM-dependent methyltransferase [Thiohalocapsa marina]
MPTERFAAEWLALREPADHRARAAALEQRLALAGARAGWRRILDLGCGTGANLRHLAPRLPWARDWTLIDHDADLLARLTPPTECSVCLQPMLGDLHTDGLAAVARAEVVTASALLDLVSAAWLDDLIGRIHARGAAALFTLSYDGRVAWSGPADADDDWMRALVNRHQRTDKGLGAALGPDAAAHACTRFRALGYDCTLAPSPWRLQGSADTALATAWLEGWAQAAAALVPTQGRHQGERIQAWCERRRAAFTSGGTALEVGHLDLLALPI